MREILYRGQTRRKGEKVYLNSEPVPSHWVYGGIFLNNYGGDFAIIYSKDPIEKHTVYADTVGQYTGFVDKYQTKIFEGDIVRVDDLVPGKEKICRVRWHEDFARFVLEYDTEIGKQRVSLSKNVTDRCVVIGNIYDSEELLSKE